MGLKSHANGTMKQLSIELSRGIDIMVREGRYSDNGT